MPPFMTFLLVRAGLNKACPPLVEFCASVLLLQRQNWIRDLEKEVIQRFLKEGISKQTYSAFLTPQLLLVRDPAVRQARSLSSREVSPYTMCLCTTGQQTNPSSVPQVYKRLDVPSPEVFHTQGSFSSQCSPKKGCLLTGVLTVICNGDSLQLASKLQHLAGFIWDLHEGLDHLIAVYQGTHSTVYGILRLCLH